MRLSRLFFQTLRQAPAEAETASHKLLQRAGYIYQTAAGHFTAMPLGQKLLDRLINRLIMELNGVGAQLVGLPGLKSEPGETAGAVVRFPENLFGKKTTGLVQGLVHSYKQLPQTLFRFVPDWNENPRPRLGWLGQRQTTTLEVYGYVRDEDGIRNWEQTVRSVVENVLQSFNLPVETALAPAGLGQGRLSTEWVYPHPSGNETVLTCPACGYKADQRAAAFRKPPTMTEEPLPMCEVATPGAKTIDDLCAFLHIQPARTAKAVFLTALLPHHETLVETFVFAVVRGDMDVNEHKLACCIGAVDLRPATEEEIRKVGAVPGYASPLGLKDVLIVVDELVLESPNLVSGANREGYHMLNVNAGRDYTAGLTADICMAREGSACPVCGQILQSAPVVVLGSLLKFSAAGETACTVRFLGEEGLEHPAWMGLARLDFEKLAACAVEVNHDEAGIKWPLAAAPFHVHLVGLNGAEELAETLYETLTRAGLDVLYDDRPESPGVKFNDADLMGLPLRLTAGKRAMKENAVEFKVRAGGLSGLIPLDKVVDEVKLKLAELEKES